MIGTALSGLLIGVAFGFVLERAGFGNPGKLTAQFRWKDWSVFKVMFTAIVFTAVGLMILEKLQIIDAQNLFVPPAFLGAAAIGGSLIGAGFSFGGYCPGTSVVGSMSGRIDAMIFVAGLVAGTALFAWLFPTFEPLTVWGEVKDVLTLPEALHISDVIVNVVLVVAAVGVFYLGSWMEKKLGGPVRVSDQE
jgi:hypothetical protein